MNLFLLVINLSIKYKRVMKQKKMVKYWVEFISYNNCFRDGDSRRAIVLP